MIFFNFDSTKIKIMNLRNTLTFTILLFCSGLIIAQTLEERIKELEKENAELKRELEDCKSLPLIRALNNVENQKFTETPKYSRKELHTIFLPKIKKQSEKKYNSAKDIIEKTEAFILFCESINNDLIERTGGLNPSNQRPKGCYNKEIVNLVLVQEGKGAELKEKIILLKDEFLKIVAPNPYYNERITLGVEPFPKGKFDSWEAYNFTDMPLCAIMTTIASFKSKAEASEIATLQYLKE